MNWYALLPFSCLIGIIIGAAGPPQVHPKFQTRSGLGEILTVTDGLKWLPSMPPVLFHAMATTRQDLVLTIENLPPNKDFELTLHYRCSPEIRDLTPLKFDLKSVSREIICRIPLPLEIHLSSIKWTSGSTCQIEIEVAHVPPSRVLFKDTLTHFVFMKFQVTGPKWSLQSNGLYFRNWDPLFRRGPYWFLPWKAVRLLLTITHGWSTGFHRLQFIDTQLVKLISRASELDQSTISIGAMVEFNGHACDGRQATKSMAFMSAQYPLHYMYSSMKVLRLDSHTGQLTYSRAGVNNVARQAKLLAASAVAKACPSGGWDCTHVKACARLQYSARANVRVPYERSEPAAEYTDTGGTSITPATRECQVLSQRQSTLVVFARTIPQSIVVCPIVCSRSDESFAFYKGAAQLTPGAGEFTQYGGLQVHKSGAAVVFGLAATSDDSGEYTCTAGGKEARFIVEVVALPQFNVPETAFWRGGLPAKIYAMEGDGYSVSCTVSHAGMRSVTLTPEFYVVTDRSRQAWTKMFSQQFKLLLQSKGSNVQLEEGSNATSTSLALKVERVPPVTAIFDFSHRLVCNAAASLGDVQRFGLTEYAVQSGSDVLLVPRPAPKHIISRISDCCYDKCLGQKCVVEFSLDSGLFQELRSLGVEVRAAFRLTNFKPGLDARPMMRFHADKALLQWQTAKGVNQMVGFELQNFFYLVPIFFYHYAGDKSGPPKVTIERRQSSDRIGALQCYADPYCIYSTDFDAAIYSGLTLGSHFSLKPIIPVGPPPEPPTIDPSAAAASLSPDGGSKLYEEFNRLIALMSRHSGAHANVYSSCVLSAAATAAALALLCCC